jgi:hypothetical protein
MGQRFAAAFLCAAVRARGCWNDCLSRAAAALCAAPCRLAQPGLQLVSAFLSYLLSPARDVVRAAYDVLFSQ